MAAEKQQPIQTIAIVGDSGIGKTTLLQAYADANGANLEIRNEGSKYVHNAVSITTSDGTGQLVYDKLYTDAITDLRAGWEYNSYSYKNTVDGVIVAFDLTSQKSYENVKQRLKDMERYAREETAKIFVGLKSDLVGERVVEPEIAKEFFYDLGTYIECSAQTGEGVKEVFAAIGSKISEKTSAQGFAQREDARRSGNGTGCCIVM